MPGRGDVLVDDFVTSVTVAISLGVIVLVTWVIVPMILRRRPEG